LALSLPETDEQDHHGMTSFRVRRRIFATVPDNHHVRIMASEPEILRAIEDDPLIYEALYWGKRLACVVVAIRSADLGRIEGLMVDAWLQKAPVAAATNFRKR
jgi:hypothetical protein